MFLSVGLKRFSDRIDQEQEKLIPKMDIQGIENRIDLHIRFLYGFGFHSISFYV